MLTNQFVIDPVTKKPVGKTNMIGELVFHCKPERYFTPKHGRAGVSKSRKVIENARAAGIRKIKVVYKGKTGDKIFITTPANWLRKGQFHYSHGYGAQLVLAEEDFDEVLA